MTRRWLGTFAATFALLHTAPAAAQTTDAAGSSTASSAPSNSNTAVASGPMTSDEAVGHTASPAPPNPADRSELLNYRGSEYSLGWRAWGMAIPAQIVGLFANISPNPGWNGSLGIATGPEFVYRHDGTDVAIGVMYVDYHAGDTFMRGNGADMRDEERITSTLWGLYLTAHILWGIHIARVFEIQIGGGIGVGYIGGNLYRSQAYTTDGGSTWHDCEVAGGPGGSQPDYCDAAQSNHFSGPGGSTHYTSNSYADPGIFSHGNVPTIIPWVSIPHIAFHIRPVEHLDIKLEGGFALIGVYAGGSIHWVF